MHEEIKSQIEALYKELDGNDVAARGIKSEEGLVMDSTCRVRHTQIVEDEFDAPDGWALAKKEDDKGWYVIDTESRDIPENLVVA